MKEAEDNIREMLVFEGSVLHVVFVGNETRTVSPESALGMMAAEGKADWVFVGSDFQAPSDRKSVV